MGELFRWKKSRDEPDTLNALLEYPEGFAVNLSSTFNNQLSAEGSFQALGTEGSLLLNDGLTFVAETGVDDNRWVVESWPCDWKSSTGGIRRCGRWRCRGRSGSGWLRRGRSCG